MPSAAPGLLGWKVGDQHALRVPELERPWKSWRDCAQPPLFSEYLRRAGTSYTMNHIITRVPLAFPTTQADFPRTPSASVQGQWSIEETLPPRGQLPQAPPHPHSKPRQRRKAPNTHAPTFEPRTPSHWTIEKRRACTEPWDLTQLLVV